MADAELVQRVEVVSQERALVAAELEPRRREEARVLARLRSQKDALLDQLEAYEDELERNDALRETALDRLTRLEDGLSARQRRWARVGEPLVLSVTTLGALVPMGLGASMWFGLGAAVGGLLIGFAARSSWRRRG